MTGDVELASTMIVFCTENAGTHKEYLEKCFKVFEMNSLKGITLALKQILLLLKTMKGWIQLTPDMLKKHERVYLL